MKLPGESPVQTRKSVAVGLLGAGLVLAAFLGGLFLLIRFLLSQYDQRVASEPVAWIEQGGHPVAVTVVAKKTCWSYRSRGSSVSRSYSTSWFLQANDVLTAERLALVPVPLDSGTYHAALMGSSGNRIWLYTGQPLAYELPGLKQVADKDRIEAANPTLKGLLPKEERYYHIADGRLTFVANDGQPYALDAATLLAKPVDDDDRRSGSHDRGRRRMDDSLRNGFRVGRQVFGLLSEEERRRAGDTFHPGRPNGDTVRRRLYVAQATRPDRPDSSAIDGFRPTVDQAQPLLQAGLLTEPGTDSPIQLAGPDGVVVVHRRTIGDKGPLTVSRQDRTGRLRWSSPQAFIDFADYARFGDRLVFLARENPERSRSEADLLVAIDLQTGDSRTYDFGKDALGPQ